MRAFVEMRKLIASNEVLLKKIEDIEKRIDDYDENFHQVFQVLKQLIETPETSKRQIGFKTKIKNRCY